jgi:hypothetical protein
MDSHIQTAKLKLVEVNKGVYRLRQAKRTGHYDESQLAKLNEDLREAARILETVSRSSDRSLVTKLKKDLEQLKVSLEETAACEGPAVHSEQVTTELVLVEAYNEEEEKAKVFSEYRQDLTAINQIMKEVSLVVEASQQGIDQIEAHVDLADRQVSKATGELHQAAKLETSRLRWIIGSSLSVVGGTIGILGGPLGVGLGKNYAGAALGGYVGSSLGKTLEAHERVRLEGLAPEGKPQD